MEYDIREIIRGVPKIKGQFQTETAATRLKKSLISLSFPLTADTTILVPTIVGELWRNLISCWENAWVNAKSI
jgi:hypothetical protein